MIELLGWGTDKVTVKNFLVACNVADFDVPSQELRCRDGFSLHPFRAIEDITVVQTPAVLDVNGNVVTPAVIAPGAHFNLRIYGSVEQALIDAAYNSSGTYPNGRVWSAAKIVNYVNNKLATTGTLIASKGVSGARLPIGYQWTVGGKTIQLYDAALVNNRANVWA